MGALMVPEPTFCYPHRGIPSPRRVIVCRGAGALRFEVYKGGLETHSGTPICGVPKDRKYSLCVPRFSPVKDPRTASYYITLNWVAVARQGLIFVSLLIFSWLLTSSAMLPWFGQSHHNDHMYKPHGRVQMQVAISCLRGLAYYLQLIYLGNNLTSLRSLLSGQSLT